MIKLLYKKDTTGKIRCLQIEVEGDTIIQSSGLLDGKPTVHTRKAKGKNKGRANETTPKQQAIKEAEALIVKKLKEGYFESIEDAESTSVLSPMLANKLTDVYDLEYPVYVQPKLDGIRCLTYDDKKWSRKNREISMNHIPTLNGLDGELYAHGKTFQEVTSLVKKQRPESADIKYHVYDCHTFEGTFTERYAELFKMVKGLSNVELVDTIMCSTPEELKTAHKINIKNGYEGTIVRLNNETYQYNKRDKQLLKLKDFIDAEFTIINVVPSDKRPEHGTVVCEMPDGRVFNCGMKVSHERREYMLINKEEFIGQLAKLEFFEYTDGGIPRFPIFIGERWEADI